MKVSWRQVSLVQSAIGDGVERSTADFGELLQVLRSRAKESKEGANSARADDVLWTITPS